jgi:hypothetical protein
MKTCESGQDRSPQRSRMPGLVAVAMAAAFLIAGCGGGGDSAPAVGGGPTTNTSAFRVTLDRSSVAFSYVEGLAPVPIEILTAVGTGTPPSQLYVAATAAGTGIDAAVPVSINGLVAQATLRPQAGLAAGDYAGTIRFLVCTDVNCGNQVAGSPLTVGYTIKVLPPLTRENPTILVGGDKDPALPLSGTANVDAPAGSPDFTWTATSQTPWLRLTRNSGPRGTPVAFDIDWAHVLAMPNGASSVATILLSTSRPLEAPSAIAVTVRRSLPVLETATPYVLVAGRASRVIVRGTGFDGVAQPITRLAVSNAVVTAATKINDRALLVDLTPTAAGDLSVRMFNAQNVATAGTNAWVVPQREYAYHFQPGIWTARPAKLDPATNSVFAANPTDNLLMRWSYNGTAWVSTNQVSPSINGVGLSRDGRWVVATTEPPLAILRRYDSATLAVDVQHTDALPFGNFGFNGIATTNDGRMWLGLGAGSRNGVRTYQPETNLFAVVIPSDSGAFPLGSGPWFAVARNGERLLTNFDAGSSSLRLHYLDASEGVMRPGPAGVQLFISSSSDHGERTLHSSSVMDRALTRIATLALPFFENQAYLKVGGAMSADGRRAYELGIGVGPTARVYVYDTTSPAGAEILPMGHFELPHAVSCREVTVCLPLTTVLASADGNTLFAVGPLGFQVIPIPTQYRSTGGPLLNAALQAAGLAGARPMGAR